MIEQTVFYGLAGIVLGAIVTGAFAYLKGEFKPWNLLVGGLIGVTLAIPIAIATGFLKVSGLLAIIIFIVISRRSGSSSRSYSAPPSSTPSATTLRGA